MSRSTVPALKRFHGPAILFAVLALALLLPSLASACGEEGGEDTGPLVSKTKVSPPGLPQEGGQVAVYATVEDDCGVFMVYAGMYGPEGNNQSIQMLPWEIAPNGVATYRGEANIPPNYQEYAINYGFTVQATDTNGAYIEEYAGDVEVAGVPQFDEAPYVSSPVVGPRELPASGGSVKIRATATDNRSVSVVYATVTLPDGSTIEVPMEPISCCEFEGVLTVPPNTSVTPQHYSIEIIAQDDIGQPGSIDAGLVTVAATAPPPTSHLMVEPDSLSFGSVRIGRQAGQFLLLENTGPKSSGRVQGVIVTSGSPFSLAGGKPAGAPFRLRPGQSKRYRIRFRPRTLGDQIGTARILSSDKAQPEIVVPLSGQGVCRCPTRPR